MVRDLNIPVAIQSVATVREASGLAMSSRNAYLTSAERATAALLYEKLCSAREAVLAGQLTYQEIEGEAMRALQGAGFQPDYFAICRPEDLQPSTFEDNEWVILVAAKLGRTRLIDNISFTRCP
jgi:pantoate--beta-alanine ligase